MNGVRGSALDAIASPDSLPPEGRKLFAVLRQFETTEWWSPERLAAQQLKLLERLLAHGLDSVPYYKDRRADYEIKSTGALTAGAWSQLPVLKRSDVQNADDYIRSTRCPKQHGRIVERWTSGSVGKPLKVQSTELSVLYSRACMMRFTLWHDYDLKGKMASMRAEVDRAKHPQGYRANTWGKPFSYLFRTGPSTGISSVTPIPDLVAWLEREAPNHLICQPHVLAAMARHCLETETRVTSLRSVSTYAHIVTPLLRQLCQRAWGATLGDIYSAEEVNAIALQCPERDCYHVQSENLLVEILDDRNQACEPGKMGRVVVTPLHNYMTPLIRYEIGDYAIAGDVCSCGRGLPVLAEISGRMRDMLTLPDGSITSPGFVNQIFQDFPIAQFQVVQHSPLKLETKIVRNTGYTSDVETKLLQKMIDVLPADYEINFSYHEEIPRSAGGKYFDFISKVSPSGLVDRD